MIELNRQSFALAALIAGALGFVAPLARAQEAPEEPAAEVEQPAPADEAKEDAPPSPRSGDSAQPPRSLDELLGIDGAQPDEAANEPVPDESAEELERRLDEEDLTDSFGQALAKMLVSADMLDERFDTGLETQRIQEDILAQLDRLIDLAKKSQCQGGSSSSGKSGASSSGGVRRTSQPGKRSESQNQSQQRANGSQGREADPPPMRQAELNPVLDASTSEWGTLPARVRDELLQGRREKFSSLYDHLTKEYYRRLAEEGR